jgi:hypothetical protein
MMIEKASKVQHHPAQVNTKEQKSIWLHCLPSERKLQLLNLSHFMHLASKLNDSDKRVELERLKLREPNSNRCERGMKRKRVNRPIKLHFFVLFVPRLASNFGVTIRLLINSASRASLLSSFSALLRPVVVAAAVRLGFLLHTFRWF